jgi:sugar phosphate isomerase/epimerase
MERDRRSLLKGLAAGLIGAGVPATSPNQRDDALDAHAAMRQAARRWGVQLYTVRTQIEADAAATLKRIADIGYGELEVLQATLPVVAPIASGLGLNLVSAHLDGPTAKGDGLDTFLVDAKRAGVRDLVVPSIAQADRPSDPAGVEAVAARLSRMTHAVTAAGLRLCYHNHAFEFGQDRDGRRWLDVLMRGTAEAGLQLQLDVFWASIGGADPVTLLRQYKGRVASLHLKDKDPSAGTTLVESAVARTAFVEVGSGALDFPGILGVAREAGVRHYFVEQDQTPGDPVESLRKSYAYLAALTR